MYELKNVHDPMVGGTSKRIVHKASNSIVVKKSEVSKIVNCVYQETKGDGAAKLKIHASHQYSGISRRIIEANLNSMKQNQKVRPLFQSKALLRPIHDRTENACTVSTSGCPIQSLRKLF